MKVVLIGFATSYKTSAGKLLAQNLNLPFWDVDDEVQKSLGKSVEEIFSTLGEDAFRLAEGQALHRLTNVCGVVACGGGSVLSPNFAHFAQNSQVVWLKTSPQTVKSRLKGGRPLFDCLSAEQLQAQVALRERTYEKYAEFCVVTDGKTSRQVATEVEQLLADVAK